MSCEPTSSQQVILPATDPNEKNTKKERKESWGGGGENVPSNRMKLSLVLIIIGRIPARWIYPPHSPSRKRKHLHGTLAIIETVAGVKKLLEEIIFKVVHTRLMTELHMRLVRHHVNTNKNRSKGKTSEATVQKVTITLPDQAQWLAKI